VAESQERLEKLVLYFIVNTAELVPGQGEALK
jgi:hypothetical protein